MADTIHGGNLTQEERFNRSLRFLVLADNMKGVYRRTLLADKSRRETDAEHSWHLALMAIVFSEFAPEGTDINRVIKMCIVHDLVEIFAGDTFCYDYEAAKDKEQRETEAADRLFEILPEDIGSELKALWREFDEAETHDAAFAASLDRFQPIINNFLTDGHTWRGGKVKREMVEKRAEIIKKGFPAAEKVINDIINDSDEKGFFTM